MRLWHYKLIPVLPDLQLLSQWRELNSIFAKQPKHILINYVYEYDYRHLLAYTYKVVHEMLERGYKIKSTENANEYFNKYDCDNPISSYTERYMDLLQYFQHPVITINFDDNELFKNHHNDRYLLQCFYNLQEKYDRGQKGFDSEKYIKLYNFVNKELGMIL